MVAALEGAGEVAVDLEHHSFRSFLGITCLMQVSDRTADYVVDVIKLRPLIGPLLAPLFADPQVPPPLLAVAMRSLASGPFFARLRVQQAADQLWACAVQEEVDSFGASWTFLPFVE
jgi:hypothetical protein